MNKARQTVHAYNLLLPHTKAICHICQHTKSYLDLRGAVYYYKLAVNV